MGRYCHPHCSGEKTEVKRFGKAILVVSTPLIPQPNSSVINLTMIIFNEIQKANNLLGIQIPEHTHEELL